MISETVKAMILEILEKSLDISELDVFIFGSHATNQDGKFSDIDLGIKGKNRLVRQYLM